MLFLILAGTKKSLLDVAVFWISITSDHMWLHSGHCCLFHCNVSFFLAEQEIVFVSASGSIEVVMMHIKMHVSCELGSLKDLKLLFFTSMVEFSGRNLTRDVLNGGHMSYQRAWLGIIELTERDMLSLTKLFGEKTSVSFLPSPRCYSSG
jgi:hypothetical protein